MNKFIKLHGRCDGYVYYLNVSHIISFFWSDSDNCTKIVVCADEYAPCFYCQETLEEILELIKSL